MRRLKNGWSARIRVLISLLCIVVLHSTTLAETVSDDAPEDVLEAIKSSPIVQAEVTRTRQRVAAKESVKEKIKIVSLGGLCGAAGCSTRYLAVITVHRGGVNPQTGSVLATVDRRTPGGLGKVAVVELKPKEAVETRVKVQRKYSSPLPIIRQQ